MYLLVKAAPYRAPATDPDGEEPRQMTLISLRQEAVKLALRNFHLVMITPQLERPQH